jgi:hypothetical protein
MMSDSSYCLEMQAISILNQCRHHISRNRPENALNILENGTDLKKWLFCTKEISAWTNLTAALAYSSLHRWADVMINVKLAIECENDSIEIHLCVLELLTQYFIHSEQL